MDFSGFTWIYMDPIDLNRLTFAMVAHLKGLIDLHGLGGFHCINCIYMDLRGFT